MAEAGLTASTCHSTLPGRAQQIIGGGRETRTPSEGLPPNSPLATVRWPIGDSVNLRSVLTLHPPSQTIVLNRWDGSRSKTGCTKGTAMGIALKIIT
jgi:hypothetical protein